MNPNIVPESLRFIIGVRDIDDHLRAIFPSAGSRL